MTCITWHPPRLAGDLPARWGMLVLLLFLLLSPTSLPAAETGPVEAPAAAADDWDMDWEDPAPAPGFKSGAGDSGATATSAEPSTPAADGEAQPPAAGQGDEWDWDWSETDTGPAYKSGAATTTQAPAAVTTSTKPRVGETAEPDFDSSPISGRELFAGTPEFGVIPSKKDTDMHPCANCHTWAVSNPTPRKLLTPHENFVLKHGLHGEGEFWCFTCHDLKGGGELRTLEGEQVGFDEAYILCAQCHPGETKDWSFGAHGKRVDNWQGNRRILNCTACHYQHNPAIKPREAVPPPPVRRGLVRNDNKPHVEQPLWDQIRARRDGTNAVAHP